MKTSRTYPAPIAEVAPSRAPSSVSMPTLRGRHHRRRRIADRLEGNVLAVGRQDGAPMEALLRLPATTTGATRLLVLVHGISRDHVEQVRGWSNWADEHGFLLLAPHFDALSFPGYQRLEAASGGRADQALLQLLRWLPTLGYPLPARRVLFGHSGGAQFAHRFLLAHPFTFDGAILSSAGWYTWPNAAEPFPYGTGASLRHGRRPLDPLAWLQVPMLVTVGELDHTPDNQTRQSPHLDEVQGLHRVERAQRWVSQLRMAADERGLEPHLEHAVLPRATHAFASCMKRGLPEITSRFLASIPWLWRQTHSQS